MGYQDEDKGLRGRLSRHGEDTLGRIAEELARNPTLSGALSKALDARDKAVQAQEAAMGAMNIPSAADIERLTRRIRAVSQRLEGVEDAIDRLEARLEANPPAGQHDEHDERMAILQRQLEEVARDVAAVRGAVAPEEEPPPRAQERLTVGKS